MKRKSGRLSTALLVLVFLAGLSLMLYPAVSNRWNGYHQTQAVLGYEKEIRNLSPAYLKKEIELAREYNRTVAANGMVWKMNDIQRAEYESLLNIDGSGNMGYIEIPKLKIMLPVYHGVEERVLQRAIGHIEGSSLPVGGETSHCIVSGHRGLPSSKLFTDIDKLMPGDLFTLNVMGEVLTYEVDSIHIVVPEDFSNLALEEGSDYCTLVTCTPYGINTHRLLVRGHRVATKEGSAAVTSEAIRIDPLIVAPVLAAPILLTWIILVLTRPVKKKETEEIIKKERGESE
ncbi:MAG: class C sortase [Clostridia bacterium]|nr:class C sortase [Clostridia bacterium]